MHPSGPPPGWYDDPQDRRQWRWWDGATWTAHVAPVVTAGTEQSFLGAALASEAKMTPWAKAVVLIYPLGGIGIGLVDWADSGQWAAYFHGLRVLLHNMRTIHTQAPPLPHQPLSGALLTPLLLAAQIVFVVWQYRAATTAQRLGYPARRSPGWGISFYFIPVVALWFPYQAIRDCLPPGHQGRRFVLGAWLLLIATGILNVGLTFALAEAHPLGLLLLGLDLVGQALLALTGYRALAAISDDRKRAIVDSSRVIPT